MIYEMTVPQSIKMLKGFNAILNKALAFAESKKIEPEVLLQSRLAPDQLPLIRQIQIMTDTVKLGAVRLTGVEAPSHDDKETTMKEMLARIDNVVQYLTRLSPKDYDGAGEKHITQPRWEGKYLTGIDYVNQHLLPNLYFHVTTAYSILRHNGVDIGKKDYLGELPYKH